MPRFRTLTALLIGGVLLHAADVAEARKSDRDTPPPLLGPVMQPDRFQPPPRRGLSPDDAAREIRSRYGGRVLAVQPDGRGYRVKVLKDGEVRIYQVEH